MRCFLPIGLQDFVYRRQPAVHGPGTRASLNSDQSHQLTHLFRTADGCFLVDGSTAALVRLDASSFAAWSDYLLGLSDDTVAQDPPGLTELRRSGLFRQTQYPAPTAAPTSLHSLCLNVAHLCNLACRYCFAGEGGYGDTAADIMAPAVARRAVDLLLESSAASRTVNIDFFGGEPLLAWDTVVDVVGYATQEARAKGGTVHFTLTTNGVGLTAAQARFAAEHMATIIVSLDGRPEVHDRMRVRRDGEGSYAAALAGAGLLQDALSAAGRRARKRGRMDGSVVLERPDRPIDSAPLWARGTFTRHNLDFWRDVEHLLALGFDQISLEPVSAPPSAPYSLQTADLPQIRESYSRIADLMRQGGLRFFHFELNQRQPACAVKRYSGCAAGAGYGCVAPGGELYPCHQFDGDAAFAQGNVLELASYPTAERLLGTGVGAKQACRQCWAQLFCGGGCHYASWRYGGGLLEPPPLYCMLTRTRLECALSLQGTPAGPAKGL